MFGTAGTGIFVQPSARVRPSVLTENVFARNGCDIAGEGWAESLRASEKQARQSKLTLSGGAALWAAQQESLLAALDSGTALPDFVPTPATFDVTVAPGEAVQAAVDACPPGGSVLLLPGTHAGPLYFSRGRDVRIFGRGQAVLRTSVHGVVRSVGACITLDGLVIRRDCVGSGTPGEGVATWGGRLRLQACDITSARGTGVIVSDGASATVSGCRCVVGIFRVRGVEHGIQSQTPPRNS